MVIILRDAQPADIDLRHPLAPHRLPQTALRRVEHAAVFEHLLASPMVRCVALVLHAEAQGILSGLYTGGDVERKCLVAARVRPRQLVVHIHAAALVAGAEIQEQPLPRRDPVDLELSLVPQVLVRFQLAVHTGQAGLRRERHADLAVPQHRSRVIARDRVFPEAV